MTKISPKNIAEAIYVSTKGKSGSSLEKILKQSVKILSEKHMLGKSEEVLSALQNIIDKETVTVRAKITTAIKISSEQKKKLEHEVKERYKAKAIVSEFFEKGEMLGGARIEVGDEVLDATYKNKFNQLERFLIQDK